jgi:hypothetical protein
MDMKKYLSISQNDRLRCCRQDVGRRSSATRKNRMLGTVKGGEGTQETQELNAAKNDLIIRQLEMPDVITALIES